MLQRFPQFETNVVEFIFISFFSFVQRDMMFNKNYKNMMAGNNLNKTLLHKSLIRKTAVKKRKGTNSKKNNSINNNVVGLVS